MRFKVTIDFYHREDITVVTEAITLADLLSQANCRLTDAEIPSVSLDTLTAADTTVKADKLSWNTAVLTEEIPYETEIIKVDTIPRGTTNSLQPGVPGEITRT